MPSNTKKLPSIASVTRRWCSAVLARSSARPGRIGRLADPHTLRASDVTALYGCPGNAMRSGFVTLAIAFERVIKRRAVDVLRADRKVSTNRRWQSLVGAIGHGSIPKHVLCPNTRHRQCAGGAPHLAAWLRRSNVNDTLRRPFSALGVVNHLELRLCWAFDFYCRFVFLSVHRLAEQSRT